MDCLVMYLLSRRV
nr:unnamed protein product [Callosobruchus chinensis]